MNGKRINSQSLMMKKFELLKQTFPISQFDRECDGYKFIIENTSKTKRITFGIEEDKLQKIIKKGEKYLYRVGKQNGKFKAMTIALSNFKIIRKYYSLFDEE